MTIEKRDRATTPAGRPQAAPPGAAEPPALDVCDLRVSFGEIEPVRGVSFSLARGARLGLVGESGSGKSLTALSIMRLARRARLDGQIRLRGRDLLALSEREMERVRGGQVAMIYQDPMSALNPVRTVGHQLVEAIRLHSDVTRRQALARAVELLGDAGVPAPARRVEQYPHEFSGGMRQRVMIAMAMCADPAVLICDEPTTALDVTTQARIIDLLDRLVEEHGTAVLLITHDLGLAAGFCDEIQVMYAGRIVERAASDGLFAAPLHPYSAALLDSACDLRIDVDAPLPAIGGQPPLAGRLPEGCSFHPRCASAEPRCAATAPPRWSERERMAECHLAASRAATAEGLHARA